MNELWFNVIVLLVPVLATIVTGFLIPLIVSKLGAEKLALIVKWVGYAVKAAEGLYKASGQGEIKKEYVVSFINKMFNSKKVNITEEQISILIESVVTEMNKTK